MPRILGLSGSLRNARTSSKNRLCEDLITIGSKDDLISYLTKQSKILVDAVLAADSSGESSYLEVYEKLRKMGGDQGLSNSEAGLACALWAAYKSGSEIDYLSLARHFPPNGNIKHKDELKEKVLLSDGLLISGPVYFGDRGSLAQSFIDFCYQDDEILEHLKNKVYAGISVGAKRNGGQETTLVYQMLDMANLGMLSVGNDSLTTSQYGGTIVAGDIGKMSKDTYGLDTCISTGYRIAHASLLESKSRSEQLTSKAKVHMLLLQDSKDRKGLSYYQNWISEAAKKHPETEFVLWDVVSEKVIRCIACDICPTDVGEAEEYRCIISRKDDFFTRHHEELIDADAILVCAYSPNDRKELISFYQQYMERSRYIRRDNYLYSDLLVAPFVISEQASNENIHLRIMTSMVRHQTIIAQPILGTIHNGELINSQDIASKTEQFIETTIKIAQSRVQLLNLPDNAYQPDGYVISKKKMLDDKKSGRLESSILAAQTSRKEKRLGRNK